MILSRQSRVQFRRLNRRHLLACPIWMAAIDEEGKPGQDEETFRPLIGRTKLDSERDIGIFVVACDFTAANGDSYEGFFTPDLRNDVVGWQPRIFRCGRQIGFWYGMVDPSTRAKQCAYRLLKTRASAFFPLRFHSRVELLGFECRGVVPGFATQDSDIVRCIR